MNEQILPVKDILVRKEVVENHFKCDLAKCKGACCTFESRYGAPISWEEVGVIENLISKVLPYLPHAHRAEIEEKGFYEVKNDEPLIRSVDNRSCVFVHFENGIAKCSLEKAYFEGETDFRKPISCHLFPIRVSDFGGDVLRYERIDECEPAIELGKKENVTIAEFCKDSLVRLYGEEWYSKFIEIIRKENANT
jgi:hypothetical protein